MPGLFTLKFPNGESRTVPADKSAYRIGRVDDNDLILNDASVSRRHARLSLEGGQLVLEDLGSANGTFVGSQQLPANTPTPVLASQTMRFGDVEVTYTPPAPAPARPKTPPPAASAEQATMIRTEGVAVGGGARFGTLQIKYPNGKLSDFRIDQPTVSVGRLNDNALVLDDASVSRRHARLTVESSRLMIEDLGSGNGTKLGGARIPANTPSLVPAGQPFLIGDVELRYEPPASVEAAQAFVTPKADTPAPAPEPKPASVPVNLVLNGPAQPVTPGTPVTATLTLHNRGSVVDELTLAVSDLPAEWVRFSKERVPLLPNAQETITLTIQPPRKPEALAKDYRFTITVTSREHKASASAVGSLRVLPFQGLSMALEPVRSRRDFKVALHNQGNAPATYGFSGADEENAFTYEFAEQVVTLQPGERRKIPLQVISPNRPQIGGRENWPFSVVAALQEAGGAEVRANGQLMIRPPIPVWVVPLALLLVLCLLGAGVFAFINVCPTQFPTAPLCPVKPTVVFTAIPNKDVPAGDPIVLAWDVENATQVELELGPNLKERVEPSGLRTLALDSSRTFILRAANANGTVEVPLLVTLKDAPPNIQSFTASPAALAPNDQTPIELSWNVVGAESVTIEPAPPQAYSPTSGNVRVPAPKESTTYTLIARNAVGESRKELVVVVTTQNCKVNTSGDRLNLRLGPDTAFEVIQKLDNGTRVIPIERESTGKWLRVQGAGREGWAQTDFIACDFDKLGIPTAIPATIPGTPTPAGGGGGASPIRADQTSVGPGQCTILRWDVQNVQAVFLLGGEYGANGQGVGGSDNRPACPQAPATTYILRVQSASGVQDYPVTVTVR